MCGMPEEGESQGSRSRSFETNQIDWIALEGMADRLIGS